MFARKSAKARSAAVLIALTAVALAPILRAQKAGLAKICPITIEVDPESVLAKHCAAKVESDNALLSAFFVQLRERKVTEKMPQPVTRYPKPIAPEDFSGTYLREPVLTTPDGTTIETWPAIVAFLMKPDGMIDQSTYIDVQSVHVTMTYLGTSEAFDFTARVRTVIAYAPWDDPYTLSGKLCHRNLCEWISDCTRR